MSSKLVFSTAAAVSGLSLLLASACSPTSQDGLVDTDLARDTGPVVDPGTPIPDPGTTLPNHPTDVKDGCGPGYCDAQGRFCEDFGCYEATSQLSIAMCQCDLLDPACGIGFCDHGAYISGSHCPAPVGYSPTSPISLALCGDVPLDPKTCGEKTCTPHSTDSSAGVCDGFSPNNGAEPSSPSPGLVKYIGSVYPNPVVRGFDASGADQWFGHTFTGLTPQDDSVVCGAKLTVTLGDGVSSLDVNDTMDLFFIDGAGHMSGPSWGSSLASYGVSGGTSATITIDVATLPGGAAILAQMQSGGSLDFIVQDDTAVDCLSLHVDYCCPCTDYTTSTTAGVYDDFSPANGAEPSSPSPGLAAYIAGVYPNPAVRSFDEVVSNKWFGHTFTGLAPQPGHHICGAQLKGRIGKGVSSLENNDTLNLWFFDQQGHPTGPIWGTSIGTTFGVTGGSSADISIDIGAVGGAAMLTQMQNGWLDFTLQDDTSVDYLTLDVKYCCDGNNPNPNPGNPGNPGNPSSSPASPQ